MDRATLEVPVLSASTGVSPLLNHQFQLRVEIRAIVAPCIWRIRACQEIEAGLMKLLQARLDELSAFSSVDPKGSNACS